MFYCDCQKFNLTCVFFIFLFIVTSRGIIFMCSAVNAIMFINVTDTGILEKSNGGEFRARNSSNIWSTPIYHDEWWISCVRGTYRTHTTFGVELFVILVNSFQPVYVTGRWTLVVGVLDLLLHFIIVIINITIIIDIIFVTFIITRISEQEQFIVKWCKIYSFSENFW